MAEALAAPNPTGAQGGAVWVRLGADADELRVVLYSPALARVGTLRRTPAQRGWNRVGLDQPWIHELATGLYFFRAEAERDGKTSAERVVGRLFLAR